MSTHLKNYQVIFKVIPLSSPSPTPDTNYLNFLIYLNQSKWDNAQVQINIINRSLIYYGRIQS